MAAYEVTNELGALCGRLKKWLTDNSAYTTVFVTRLLDLGIKGLG